MLVTALVSIPGMMFWRLVAPTCDSMTYETQAGRLLTSGWMMLMKATIDAGLASRLSRAIGLPAAAASAARFAVGSWMRLPLVRT